jgi:hypothetical protein
MSEARSLALSLIDEAIAARAHFQVWWALRNVAVPKYLPTMDDYAHVDFFHASNAGHYKVFLLALSKIFDRHPQAGGMQALRNALRVEGHGSVAEEISLQLEPFAAQIRSVDGIRNKSLVHNEKGMPRSEVYALNEVTPDQLRELIDKTAEVMNQVAHRLGISNGVFEGDRLQRATISMLERLARAAPNKSFERTREG